jgi:hypothetical protein
MQAQRFSAARDIMGKNRMFGPLASWHTFYSLGSAHSQLPKKRKEASSLLSQVLPLLLMSDVLKRKKKRVRRQMAEVL